MLLICVDYLQLAVIIVMYRAELQYLRAKVCAVAHISEEVQVLRQEILQLRQLYSSFHVAIKVDTVPNFTLLWNSLCYQNRGHLALW